MKQLKEYIEKQFKLSYDGIDIPSNYIKEFKSGGTFEGSTSKEALKKIQSTHGNVNVARDIENNYNFKSLGVVEKECSQALFESVKDLEIKKMPRISGTFYYPKGSFMGWHTNSKLEGRRNYLVWASENKQSFFRYQDYKTKEVITLWDKQGWNLYDFTIKQEEPYWHCVGSMCNRISIGLNYVSK